MSINDIIIISFKANDPYNYIKHVTGLKGEERNVDIFTRGQGWKNMQ